ncbi:SDR family oxidoreductase [Polymorphobacter sp. PAMC 29334]|uniref:SDR family NAD(P)-dependent oxidoreductase n=1 Tax=Polymorphobacter sp. PAMC 29334 TaxID=2862331 RepID=UPI001C664C35|nr:SDR family oxidoreductase [Polymorphobacter sp. PAMC 29334]QYE34503.1 SDR family oxidoreductase [Polymorphobacter sp. PAMC 29334]
MTNILLTGSTRGIGAAAHAALIAAGATVVGHGSRDGDGPDTVTIGADLAEPGAGDRLWDAALDRLGGRIDVLVNNAGVFEAAPLADAAAWETAWERSWRINLQAAADLSRRAVLHFQERGSLDKKARDTSGVAGRIVNVSSRAAFRGDSPAHWHYAAAKAGMVAMTRSIARAYAADGIVAFVVAPGFTMTGMAEEFLASREGDKVIADIPLGRVASAAEVAETIRWLSLDAPASLTGAVLDVNGASYVR